MDLKKKKKNTRERERERRLDFTILDVWIQIHSMYLCLEARTMWHASECATVKHI